MPELFDPYRKWLGIPPEERPPHHYRLLGIAVFEDDSDVIAYAADRQMTHVRKFQSGRYAQHSHQLLNELAQARLCLLSPQQKAVYDEQLRTRLASAGGQLSLPNGVAAPPLSNSPQAPPKAPTPPPASPPQTAPPPSAPPVATMEPSPGVRGGKTSSAQSSVSVKPGAVTTTVRRGRKRSQGPVTIVLCVIAVLGMVAAVLAVAVSYEMSETGAEEEEDRSYLAGPSSEHNLPAPTPSPRNEKPKRKQRPRPNEVKDSDSNKATSPQRDKDSSNSGSNSDADDKSDKEEQKNNKPPPNLNDPERRAKLDAAIAAAETALANRDIAEALAQVETAAALSDSKDEQKRVADLADLQQLNEQFWQAVDRGLKRMKNGDEVGFQSTISNFVSADEGNITLLITGNRETVKLDKLAVPYLIAMAERGLSRKDPNSRLVIAAFLAVDNRDRSPEHLEYARKMLAQASSSGAKSAAVESRLAAEVQAP